jgi:hypothetical protein
VPTACQCGFCGKTTLLPIANPAWEKHSGEFIALQHRQTALYFRFNALAFAEGRAAPVKTKHGYAAVQHAWAVKNISTATGFDT